MLDVSIVPLHLSDIRTIYRLEQKIFPHDAYPYLDLAIMLLMPGMVNLKAVDDSNQLLGFISATNVWIGSQFRPSWVVTLGVQPEYQNRGLGGILLRSAELRLRTRRIRLTVRRSNEPAIHLYEKTGYEQIEVNRAYYRNGEDGLIMEKYL